MMRTNVMTACDDQIKWAQDMKTQGEQLIRDPATRDKVNSLVVCRDKGLSVPDLSRIEGGEEDGYMCIILSDENVSIFVIHG
jgi:hypothetical protein